MARKVYISGFSCRFPKSDSPEMFWNNLTNHVDMVSNEPKRWPSGAFGIPKRLGTLQDIEKFDADFFEVHPKQAHKMDPQLRKLLEVSYEAILDSGLQPESLKTKKVGVFIGAHSSDSQSNFSNQLHKFSGYENTGTTLSMFANRLSFYYNFTGPSMTIDTACSSSLVALDAALNSIREGRCDYALVGGTNIILNPAISLGFHKLQMVGSDGVCRSFDNNGKGYVRSEGIGVLFLTREGIKARRRAVLLASGVNSDGHTTEGITFPNGSAHQALLEETYKRADIDLQEIEYIEAHGTGTPAGDPQEVNALSRFTEERNKPLNIGSVKSNMGHSEGAAAMAGLIKLLLAMEHNTIPANLHFNQPNEKIPGLHNGRINVVTSNQKYCGGILGVNSFGFGGTNAHAVLAKYKASKATTEDYQPIQIIPVTCRTEDGHRTIIESLKRISSTSLDIASHQRNIANRPTAKFPYRHCLLINSNGNVQTISGEKDSTQNEIWYVFNGMGSQWQGMGKALLNVPILNKSLLACHDHLTQFDFNLAGLLTSSRSDSFDTALNSFIGIAAIQIAFIDAFQELNILADGFVGHSIGEIAAAYADGAITKEQAMEIAYWRGRVVEETPSAKGSMASVAIDWLSAQELSNEDIFPACHNNDQSVTFSGPTDKIAEWSEGLKRRDIEVRHVKSAGIAFHSPMIAPAEAAFRSKLEKIIIQPKARSKKWICTCHPKDDWHKAEYASTDYFVDNLLCQVHFKQGIENIPDNATVIEVGPHLLLSSLITAQKPAINYMGLMRRNSDNTDSFHQAVGKLFCLGQDIAWPALYPEDEECYSRSLPSLHRVDWNHDADWEVADFFHYNPNSSGKYERNFEIDLKDEQYAFISDHVLNGKIIFPGVGYLYLVWQTLAEIEMRKLDETPVEFRDVTLKRATTLSKSGKITLTVRYLPVSESFEVTEGSNLVVHGHVTVTDQDAWSIGDQVEQSIAEYEGESFLTSHDLYKELRLRGYDYGPEFKKVESISQDGSVIKIHWDGNWATFLDCLVHTTIVRDTKRQTKIPVFVRKINIDPTRQPDYSILPAYSEPYLNQFYTHSILVEGAKFTVIPPHKDRTISALKSYEFTPYFESNIFNEKANDEIRNYIKLTTQYIFNNAQRVIKELKLDSKPLPPHILQLEQQIKELQYTEIDKSKLEYYLNHPRGISLRLAQHLYSNPEILRDEPLSAILSFNEYRSLYNNDLAGSYLFSEGYLEELHFVFLENIPHKKPLKVCEIGAGTGGITSHLLPLIQSTEDTYFITDISSGFFKPLEDEFKQYSAITRFEIWDIDQQAPANVGEDLDLIVASNAIHAADNILNSLQHIYHALNDDGFFLLHETTHGGAQNACMWGFIDELWDYNDPDVRSYGALVTHETWQQLLKQAGFEIVSIKDDGILLTLYLCRKKRSNAHKSIQYNDYTAEFRKKIQHSLTAQEEANNQRIWVSGDAKTTPGLPGMMNCLRKEETKSLRCLFFEDNNMPSPTMLTQAYEKDLFMNVFKEGEWGSYRYHNFKPSDEVLSGNATMVVSQLGDLSSLKWTTSPQHLESDHDYDVYYCGLNFKDVMLASGKLPSSAFDERLEIPIGGEFSGISTSGQRVMGYLGLNQKTKIKLKSCSRHHIWEIPEEWSLAEAATVPVVYMTAILALVIRGQIKTGHRVLIHSGSGGVGQAAIRVALHHECEIFITVGNDEKRKFINSMFPEIPDSHIFSSRDTKFEKEIMNLTKGKGVNLILNSLSDDKLKTGLRLLDSFGKFLEIGKYDANNNTQIGMEILLRDCSVKGVGVNNIILEDGDELALVNSLLADGISNGMVKPLTNHQFHHTDLENAFRFMANGKHIGKVIIKVKDEQELATKQELLVCQQKFWCDPRRAYLITGGLGGFGLELADWLIQRGAKTICLTSRRGITNGYQRLRVDYFRSLGINVIISTKNVAFREQAQDLLLELNDVSPIAGIFHLAMVLQDAFYINQSHEDYKKVVTTKVDAASNIDILTRLYCEHLQHFVIFSSLVASLGNPGQSAYGYANSALDLISTKRRNDGLPATSIQWGEIGDVGFVSENREKVHIEALATQEQSLKSCLSSLNKILCGSPPVVASYVPLNKDLSTQGIAPISSIEVGDFDTLTKSIKSILGLNHDTKLDEKKLFLDYGIDSLMGVEIVQKLEREYHIQVPLAKVKDLSFTQLKTLFDENSNSNIPNQITYNFIADREFPVFDRFDTGDIQNSVIYFITGLFADPFEPISIYPPAVGKSVFAVRYEHTESIDQLATLWNNHLHSLPDNVTTIKIIGYSTGASILHRLVHSTTFERANTKITTTTISPPEEAVFSPLKDMKIDDLNQLKINEGMSQIKTLPVWGDYSLIPFTAIKKQISFLMADDFHEREHAPVDLIVLPSKDPICWSYEKSEDFAQRVEVVDGPHDIRKIKLTNYY